MALNSYRAAKVFSINPFCAVNYTSFIKKEEWGRRGKRRGESFLLLFFFLGLESYPEAPGSEREGANWRPTRRTSLWECLLPKAVFKKI